MPDERTTDQTEHVATLGDVLGLHPDFVRDVQARGAMAIVDRADMVDLTGAQGRVLALVMGVGRWMEQRMAGGKPPTPMEQAEAAGVLARAHGVPVRLGVEIVATTLEVFRYAADQSKAAPGAGQRERGMADAAGRPAADGRDASQRPDAG